MFYIYFVESNGGKSLLLFFSVVSSRLLCYTPLRYSEHYLSILAQMRIRESSTCGTINLQLLPTAARQLHFLTRYVGVTQISLGPCFLFWHLWLLVAVEKACCCVIYVSRNVAMGGVLLSPMPILILRFPTLQRNCSQF